MIEEGPVIDIKSVFRSNSTDILNNLLQQARNELPDEVVLAEDAELCHGRRHLSRPFKLLQGLFHVSGGLLELATPLYQGLKKG